MARSKTREYGPDNAFENKIECVIIPTLPVKTCVSEEPRHNVSKCEGLYRYISHNCETGVLFVVLFHLHTSQLAASHIEVSHMDVYIIIDYVYQIYLI